jgi:hypothetical protein
MKKNLFILFAGILMFSCNPLTVLNEYNKSIDFTGYQTFEFYGWTDGDIFGNMYSKKRIEKLVQQEFQKRGLEFVEKGNGDLIISLYMVTEKRTETFTQTKANSVANRGNVGVYGYGYGFGVYYGFGPGYGWGPGYTGSTVSTGERAFNDGTLIVSAYDAKKEELVWETVATKTLNINSQTMDEDIKRAVKKIMKTYPANKK